MGIYNSMILKSLKQIYKTLKESKIKPFITFEWTSNREFIVLSVRRLMKNSEKHTLKVENIAN